jgi:hypothetical protein
MDKFYQVFDSEGSIVFESDSHEEAEFYVEKHDMTLLIQVAVLNTAVAGGNLLNKMFHGETSEMIFFPKRTRKAKK